MQTTSTTVIFSSLLLLGVMNTQIHTCASTQIPERFFYNNNNNNNERSKSSSTNLQLLEESRLDPIPLEFYEEMNNVTEISDFIHRFVAEDSLDPQLALQEKLSSKLERSAGNIPKPAGCIPDSAIVELIPLNPSTEPDIIYHPKCTRVKRCSGCCNSPLLSCQPVESETIDYQVIKYRFVGASRKMRAEGQEHVLVQNHTKCKCDCRIKKEDCNSYQVYDAAQCRCICTNHDSRSKCLSREDKIWDYEACKCKCRDSQNCTTGTVFDESQCKCIESLSSSSNGQMPALLDRRRFILKAVPVDPSDSTIYNTGK